MKQCYISPSTTCVEVKVRVMMCASNGQRGATIAGFNQIEEDDIFGEE